MAASDARKDISDRLSRHTLPSNFKDMPPIPHGQKSCLHAFRSASLLALISFDSRPSHGVLSFHLNVLLFDALRAGNP